MTLEQTRDFLVQTLQEIEFTQLGKTLAQDIINKLSSLIDSRLGHLTMYREMSTLSGGEIQRIFLNAHLESNMDSLIYVLDEPTTGLHELEKEELLKSIKRLKDLGNTVIIVEHDRKIIQVAEHIVDIGPKAGIAGGEVIYEGDYAGLLQCDKSLTGQYLSDTQKIMKRNLKPNLQNDKTTSWISIKHAKTNNLKDVSVSFPLGVLVGIAGVSGSGKSSLISDTLVPMLKDYFRNYSKNILDCDESDEDSALVETIAETILGAESISGFAEVSQAPIGRNINSSPVTFIKIWDKIRNLFASQEKSIELGLTAGHFSFNSDGACPDCSGSGRKSVFPGSNIQMYTTCNTCKGKRYNPEALQVTYKGKNISEILDMQISEAVSLFEDNKPIVHTLTIMKDIGMGYIKLGQPTSTLSGGEAQRLKLAKEIGKKRKGNILYVMDEPTTGLSMYDTAQLIKLLNKLIENGNSVLIIEHNIDVLKSCDWIVELGPDGGVNGGTVIAKGSPKDLEDNPKSITGKYLKERL
jgi:excinuclease ABC A subunit